MKKLIYLSAIAAMIGVVSCTSDDGTLINNPKANLDINVSIPDEEISRSVTFEKSSFATNDKIGVTVLTESGLSTTSGKGYGTGRENFEYTKGSGANDWSGNLALNNTIGYVYAYFPYQSSITLDNVAIENTKDWMYGTGSAAVSSSSSSTSIAMKHALAKIKVTIANSGYTGTGTLTFLSIQSAGIYSKGTLNTLSGAVSMGTSGGTDSFSWSGTKALSGTQEEVDSWMVVPIGGTTAQNIVINATVDTKSYQAIITNITPTKGYFYTIPLSLSDKGLSLTSVSVDTWSTSSSSTTPLNPN